MSEPTPRHGNRFVDCAALNPRRASERRIEDLAARLGPFHQLAPLVDYAQQSTRRALTDEEREAAALSVWNAPATDTGRSML